MIIIIKDDHLVTIQILVDCVLYFFLLESIGYSLRVKINLSSLMRSNYCIFVAEFEFKITIKDSLTFYLSVLGYF